MTSSVQDAVFDIIAREAGIGRERIHPDSTFAGLGVGSLDAVQILFEIEEHFRIEMPEPNADFESGSVATLVEAVQRQVAGGGGQPSTHV